MPETRIDSRFTSDHNDVPTGMWGTSRDNANDKMSNTIRMLLGDSVRLSDRMAMGNIDYHSGPSHSTTSIPYAIHGTAVLVNKRITTALAGYDDPIKAILPVTIHRQQKIIVRRKYVVGGSAIITPEHTAARTVDIREDEHEVVLTRYGGDIIMNLNLFLRPEDAAEELNMKVEAQQRELENTLTALGYEAVMRDGTNIMAALARSNPAYAHLSELERQQVVEKTYIHSVFGCINKYHYPVQNILATAAKANLYAVNNTDTRKPAVLIVPAGMMDLTTFTRESSMDFSVCGIKGTDHPIPEKLTDVPLSNVLQDKSTNLRILVHLPPANNDRGAAYPQVVHNSLMSPATWATYYPVSDLVLEGKNKMRIADFKHRRWGELDIMAMIAFVNTHYKVFAGTDAANNALNVGDNIVTANKMAKTLTDADGNPCAVEMIVVRPTMTAMMQSAILATDVGKDSGELLMAYASTGIETNQTGETFRMQLRVYMGAVIYAPEKFVVLPDVAFSGAISGHGVTFCNDTTFDPETHDLIVALKSKNFSGEDLMNDYFFRESVGRIFYNNPDNGNYYNLFTNKANKQTHKSDFDIDGNTPLAFYQGRSDEFFPKTGKWEQATENFGHLGTLDAPVYADRIDGIQKFQRVPDE
jgi:hypothetical protein